jgi:hypothetical protein
MAAAAIDCAAKVIDYYLSATGCQPQRMGTPQTITRSSDYCHPVIVSKCHYFACAL